MGIFDRKNFGKKLIKSDISDIHSDRDLFLKNLETREIDISYELKYGLDSSYKKLKNDPEVVRKFILTAIKENTSVSLDDLIKLSIGDELKNNCSFIFEQLIRTGFDRNIPCLACFDFVGDELKNSPKFIRRVLSYEPIDDSKKEELVKEIFNHKRKLFNEVIESDPKAVKYLDNDIRSDRNVIYELLKINGNVILFAGSEIKKDKQFYINAVKRDPYMILNLGTMEIDFNEQEKQELILNALSSDDASSIFYQMRKSESRTFLLSMNGVKAKDVLSEYFQNPKVALRAISSDIRTLNVINQESNETIKRNLLNSIVKNEDSDELFKNELFCQFITKNKNFLTNDSMGQVLKELQKYSEKNNYIIESINLNYDEQQIAKKLGFDIENEKIKIERKKSDENSNITNNENSEIIDNNIPKNSYGVTNNNYNSNDNGVTFATTEKVYGSKLSYEKKSEANEKKKQDDSITELINLMKANNNQVNSLYEELGAIKKENELLQSKLLEKLNGGKQI